MHVVSSTLPARGRSGTEPAYAGVSARFLVPLGRALFALVFLASAPFLFTPAAVAAAARSDVPWPQVLVPLAGVVVAVGGASVLLGWRARLGAWLLVFFLVPVTLVMHRFWSLADPAAATLARSMFLKNVALIGGALLLAWNGAGPWSIDERRSRRAPEPPRPPAPPRPHRRARRGVRRRAQTAPPARSR